MSCLLKRLPGWSEILPVYAVIAFIVYAWALLWFFWQLPGWLFYLNLNDVLSALTYVLATNLAESLLVLCGTVALALILPRRWFRDVFVARGASLCIATLGYMMFLANRFQDKMAYPALPLAAWTVPVTLLAIALAVYLGGRVAVVRRSVEVIAERATVFLYVLLPASVLSAIAISIRLVVK